MRVHLVQTILSISLSLCAKTAWAAVTTRTDKPSNSEILVVNKKIPKLPEGHPRIFAKPQDKTMLQEKIRDVKWAKEIYEKDIKGKVAPYVERHKTDPSWIISRMQMNWKEGKHYTQYKARNNTILEGTGNAPYPTVRLAASRVSNGNSANIDITTPYTGDMIAQVHDGKMEKVPWKKSGLTVECINHDILELAYFASIVYYMEEDESFAKFAADIIWTFCRGAAQQEQINPDEKINSHGFLSYETLGDSRRYKPLPLAYDFIYDYLDTVYFQSDEFIHGIPNAKIWAPGHKQGKEWAFEQFHITFRKMIDNKLNRGGGLEGNWNLNEHESAILFALALEDDSPKNNGHGRQHYIRELLYHTTQTNGGYCDVLRTNIDQATGLWPEAPAGYGQGAIQQLTEYAFWYYKQGINLFEQDPLLFKAACSFPYIAFPNGNSTAWGDGQYSPIYTDLSEFMIAYAREKKDSKRERMFTNLLKYAGKRNFHDELRQSLFFFVPELNHYQGSFAPPRASFSPVHALFMGRNAANDPYNAFAYSIYGIPGKAGHFHENGLAMEIYGRGEVLGCDFGAGPDYWSLQHRRFNRMAVGHNTVVVNGLEIGTNDAMPIEIKYADPMPVPGKDDVKGISDNFQFSDITTTFHVKDVKADMRRTNAIVRLSKTTGFIVDIFRVNVLEGEIKTLDYVYHNMGTNLVHDAKITISGATNEFSFDPESGYGYDFLTDAKGYKVLDDVTGSIPFPSRNIAMQFFLPSNELEWDFFTMKSPANFRYPNSQLKKLPVPTFMIRRTDSETWNKPFVAVYEPTGDNAPPQIKSVKQLLNKHGLVILLIELKNGNRLLLLHSLSPDKQYSIGENIRFCGTFAVITFDKIYLGAGSLLQIADKKLTSPGEL